MIHQPVMVQEICDFLRIRPDGIYLDLTVGGAGHARAIAERLKGGRLLAMDWDPQAANFARDSLKDLSQARVVHENYIHMRKILDDQKIEKVDGILFDLGLSTDQLESGRGFSFKKDEPLDLRFNPNDGEPAWRILQRMRAEELAEALHEGADLKKTKNLAEKIIRMARAPRDRGLRSTHDLREAVGVSSGRFLARLAQALRILTNSEFKNLSLGLREAFCSLAPGGRVVAISFHSGEDRLVKRAFKEGKEQGFLRILTPKPLRPGREERMRNPRCQSARLRAAEKISEGAGIGGSGLVVSQSPQNGQTGTLCPRQNQEASARGPVATTNPKTRPLLSRFSAGVSYSAGTPAILFTKSHRPTNTAPNRKLRPRQNQETILRGPVAPTALLSHEA